MSTRPHLCQQETYVGHPVWVTHIELFVGVGSGRSRWFIRARASAVVLVRRFGLRAAHGRREVFAVRTQGAKFLPLIGGEDAADRKCHLGVSFFERSTG